MSSGRSAILSRQRSRVVKSAMASQQSPPSAGSTPSDQVVGNAFVHQYYHILHHSPELVYRFYQEGSKLGRPDPQGVMSSVTTMQTINEKILSMDYSEFRAEIKTVDAQESLEGGVLVLVTGDFTGKDNVRRNFTQSFFLATQDKGYYVLNDILRYVEDADHPPVNQVPANSTGATHSPKHKNPPPQEQQLLPPEEEEEEAEVVREEAPVVEVVNEVPSSSSPLVAESSSVTAVREEEPKKSSALIVEVKKETTTPLSVLAPAAARPPHANPERQATTAPTPAPAPEAPAASLNFTETSSVQEPEVDSHSVYIKNLTLNATPTQLEEEFQKFGPIKPGGIQVRSHKQEGFCFGFVEFEVASAVQSAIEASPVMIGGRQAYVEEKRPTGSRVMKSQTNKGKEKVHAEPTMKVIWDAEATAIFIELCVEQVRTGNKPHTHFNKVGWNSIVRLLNEKTNRKYNQVQLKNKWDNLKKDWVLWQSLNRGETGIGWSASKETIEAPNSWWELKLQRHPDAAKFRDRGLAHETLLNICFSDVVTTGEHAWTSVSGVLPPHMQSPEVGDDDDLEYFSATDDSVPVVRATRDDGHSQRKHQNDQSGGRKLRKVGGVTKLSRTLDRIVTAVESSTATTARDAPCCTIKDCLDAMDVTPGVERGTPLFIIGARLFLSQVHREMFIQLGDDKTRLQYLQYEQQRRQQLQQSRHQRSDNPPS